MDENLHFGPFYSEVYRLLNSHVYLQSEDHHYIEPFISLITLLIMFVMLGWTLCFSKRDIKEENRFHNVLFMGFCISILFIYRSFSFYADLYDPDEAHILTPALNILSDGKIWTAGDSTTLGPVNYLPVVGIVGFLRLFGIDCDVTFFLARLILTLILIGTFFFLYKFCIKNLTLKLTRVVLLFYVFFFSFGFHLQLQAYNSEFLFSFFFSLCIYLLYRIKISGRTLPLILSGFFCGILPYIKLQTLPMMFSYIVWVLYIIWNFSRNPGCDRPIWSAIKKGLIFFAAILIPTGAIVIYCSTYEHGLADAYFFYIKNAMAHVTGSIFDSAFFYQAYKVLLFFGMQNWDNSLFILIALSVLLLLFIRPRLAADWIFSCLILLSTLFAMVRMGCYSRHYMLFLVIPALVFLVTTLRIISDSCPVSYQCHFFSKITGLIKNEKTLSIGMVIVWLFVFGGFAQNVESQTILANKNLLIGSNKNFSDISKIIMRQTSPDDYIVVWGWEARINIYTNRRSATAQSDIERLWGRFSWSHPYPHENVTKYIDDIKTHQPKLIADVVAPGSHIFSNEMFSLENHEEIWNAIKGDYELTNIYPVAGGSYKIYTRKNKK